MRILSWPLERILQEVDLLEKQSKQIKHELFKICWHMRGSITLDDAFALSQEDKEIIANIIKDNMETTKKSGLPYF